MRRLALLALLLSITIGLPSAAAAQSCPFSGISTQDFGQGCGPAGPSQLVMGMSPGSCIIDLKIDPALCCNFAALDHWIAYGAQLPFGLPLPPPYLNGCEQWILPSRIFGPNPGTTSSHPVPPDPNLVNRTVAFQAVVRYQETLTGRVSLGSTQGVLVTFLP